MASKALAVGYGVKRLLNVEYKAHDVTASGTSIVSTPSIIQITNIDQGDTSLTRDGAQIKLTNINVKYTLEVGSVDCLVRVMLVRDTQTNQAIYSIGDLLENTGSLIINSPLNLDNKFRFNVLYNRVHKLSPDAGQSLVVGHIFKKVGTKIRYDDTGNGIADITSRSYSLVFVSNTALNPPSLFMVSRVRFIDN